MLGYSALEVGLAFLPTSVVMAFCSLKVSDRLVMRFGIRPPLVAGLLLAAASLALFSRAPVDGSFVVDVLPSMLLLGVGAGIAFNPVLLAAMGDVEPHESGLASGRRQHQLHDGRRARAGRPGRALRVAHDGAAGRRRPPPVAALNDGLQVAFVAGAVVRAGWPPSSAVRCCGPKPMRAEPEASAEPVARAPAEPAPAADAAPATGVTVAPERPGDGQRGGRASVSVPP